MGKVCQVAETSAREKTSMKVLISLGCTGGARKGFGSLGLPRCCMDHLGTRPHTCRCYRNVVGEALGRQGAGATTGSSCVYILGEQPALTSVQRPAGICCPLPGLNMTRKKKNNKKMLPRVHQWASSSLCKACFPSLGRGAESNAPSRVCSQTQALL